MKIIIEAPFHLKKSHEQDIINQVKSMSTYDDSITNADVFFKMDDGIEADSVVAEIQLHVPGKEIFASDDDRKFMNAFSGALNKVKRQLIKRKEQNRNY